MRLFQNAKVCLPDNIERNSNNPYNSEGNFSADKNSKSGHYFNTVSELPFNLLYIDDKITMTDEKIVRASIIIFRRNVDNEKAKSFQVLVGGNARALSYRMHSCLRRRTEYFGRFRSAKRSVRHDGSR